MPFARDADTDRGLGHPAFGAGADGRWLARDRRRPRTVGSICAMSTQQLSRVQRAPVRVRNVEGADADQAAITAAWRDLEVAVGSLKGRRFLAAFDSAGGWYRACVQTRDGAIDEVTPEEGALPEMLVPGGLFVRVRLRGEPPGVYSEIAPAYSLLERSATLDAGRPGLELYRRHDVVDVLMPTT